MSVLKTIKCPAFSRSQKHNSKLQNIDLISSSKPGKQQISQCEVMTHFPKPSIWPPQKKQNKKLSSIKTNFWSK
jgi:hypothetical protein